MFFVQPFASSKAMRPRVRAKVTDERLAQVCQRSQKALCDRLQHILGKRPNVTCSSVRKLGSTGKGVHGFLLFEFAFGQNAPRVDRSAGELGASCDMLPSSSRTGDEKTELDGR